MTKSNIHKALGVAALLGIALLAGCQDVSTDLKPPKYKTSIPESETRISAFQKDFPQQYASYMKNNESSVMTEYKGSIPYHKNDNVNPLPKGFKHAQPISKICGWVIPSCTNTMKRAVTLTPLKIFSILTVSTALPLTARVACPPPAGTAKPPR